jgi:DNA polymerase-3 subunit delta'
MKTLLPLAPTFIEFHQPRIEAMIRHFEESGALHSTLLFTGIEGVGKKSLVQHFLQTLFCDESVFSDNRETEDASDLFGRGSALPDETPSAKKIGRSPCGSCKSCKQTLQGQWLDCSWFDPEVPVDGGRLGTHKIHAFRELKGKLGLGPTQEPFRVVVIADADRMTTAAANSILKMLEEPPKDWIFLLTASDSSRLLPTILSRCMEIRLRPLPPDLIFSILKTSKGAEFHSTRGQVAARSAQGSLTRAMNMLGEEAWTLRSQILGLLSNPAMEWTRLVESIAKSQTMTHLALDLIESIFADLLYSRISELKHAWTHEDQKPLLLQVAEVRGLSEERLIRLLGSIAEKRKLVDLTLNGKLLAQDILIPVLEVI